jgi:hypothetical protein
MKRGHKKKKPKSRGRLCTTFSFYAPHKRLLDIWRNETGLGYSELLRLLLEEVYAHRWKREGLLGAWALMPPAFQRETKEAEHE